MHTETLDFLRLLLERCTAFQHTSCLTLTAIHPDGQHSTPSRHISLTSQSALEYALQRLTNANTLGWGAYFAVGLRKPGLSRFQRGSVTDVAALPALYVDVDNASPETLARLRSFSPTPSVIVHSGAGFHAYWLLEEPLLEMARAKQLLQGLSKALGGDDLSPAQSLRLPGTLNTKPQRDNALCHVIDWSPRRYTMTDFERFVLPQSSSFPALHRVAHSLNKQLNPDLIDAVLNLLYQGYAAKSRRGSEWIAALCPCSHIRDSPGAHFYFNPAIGCARCHGRHGTLRLIDLCFHLGIQAADYGGIYRYIERSN